MLFVSTNPSTATPTCTVVLAGGSSFDLHNIQYSTMTIKAAGVLLASPASKSITAKSELLAAVRNGESSAQGKEPRYPLLLLIMPSCRGRAPGLLPSRGLFTHSAHPHPSFIPGAAGRALRPWSCWGSAGAEELPRAAGSRAAPRQPQEPPPGGRPTAPHPRRRGPEACRRRPRGARPAQAAPSPAAPPGPLPAPAPYPLALAGVLVGVVLQRQLAVGALDFLGGGGGLHLQDVVVLRLLHHGALLCSALTARHGPRPAAAAPLSAAASRPRHLPARPALREPRLFRAFYSGAGRIFWNDAAGRHGPGTV